MMDQILSDCFQHTVIIYIYWIRASRISLCGTCQFSDSWYCCIPPGAMRMMELKSIGSLFVKRPCTPPRPPLRSSIRRLPRPPTFFQIFSNQLGCSSLLDLLPGDRWPYFQRCWHGGCSIRWLGCNAKVGWIWGSRSCSWPKSRPIWPGLVLLFVC